MRKKEYLKQDIFLFEKQCANACLSNGLPFETY